MKRNKAVNAENVEFRKTPSVYPEPFKSKMKGREKQCLSDVFQLTNITVNRTTLKPGGISSIRHYHAKCDEFIYILKGTPTLVTNVGRERLEPGMCCGFKAGDPDGHHLINETDQDVLLLEAGDNTPGDSGEYPDDDLKAVRGNGQWIFTHKDGRPYSEG